MDATRRYKLLKADFPDEKDGISKSESGVLKIQRILLTLTSIFSILLLSVFYLRYESITHRTGELSSKATFDHEGIEQCPSTLPLPASPPAPINLWAALSIEDAVQIRHWLEAPEQHLNLTATNALASDNAIYNIEAYYPAKADALAYLESPFPASRPTRYARVTIHHGARFEPTVKDYLVGPLPIGPRTEMRELTEIYHRADIPYNARGFSLSVDLGQFVAISMQPLAGVMKELFGAVAIGHSNSTLVPGFSGPFGTNGEFRRLWLSWRRNTGGSFLQPVGFYQYIDISGTDPSKWEFLKVCISGCPYH
jgi:primary-amine oxidase